MRFHFAGICSGLLVLGCATGGARTSTGSARLRDVLTRAEIEQSAQREVDLYQAIRSLRPHFLAPAPGVGRTSNDVALAVYVDRLRQNGVIALRSITAWRVEEVRYLDPTASQNELGPSASSGAIVVTMRKPQEDPLLE